MKLSSEYKKLLNLIQEDFPLVSRPFKELGEKTGFSEEEIIEFLKNLKDEGILRHFGASPDSRILGYKTCLSAISIPEEKIHIAEEIAKIPEVTHAYIRRHKLNFWFTVVVSSEEELQKIVNTIKEKYNFEVKTFPALKNFKVKAIFKV